MIRSEIPFVLETMGEMVVMEKDGQTYTDSRLDVGSVIASFLECGAAVEDLDEPSWDWPLTPGGIVIAKSVILAVRKKQVFPTVSLFAAVQLIEGTPYYSATDFSERCAFEKIRTDFAQNL